MTRAGLDSVAELLAKARGLYADDDVAQTQLDAIDRRLREPPRIAIAGIVKAGKSTLLNSLIGEQIAPTDAGECTRVVTWYRHGRTPRITVQLRDGGVERLPVRRSAANLVLDLGRRTAEEVDRIDVEWPSEHLRSTVLIDTPGIASLSSDVSARSTRFLTPESSPSEADAVIYLLRHLHASDLRFLEAFRDAAAGPSHTVNAVAVLSRADEVGAGRIDSLLSAARIADRYRRDGELRALALGVIPVAGLLAEGARTLRESEFIALRSLAALDRDVRERALVSVDRFALPSNGTGLSVDVRRALLARFGIFGVRLGAALIRAGARTSSDLADRLVQQSGLVDLQRFVGEQFRSRALALKARGVLASLDRLRAERRRPATDALAADIERITLNNHDLRELDLIARARTSALPLSPDDAAEAERIAGGGSTAALRRLALSDTATPGDVQRRLGELLERWHGLASSPLHDRETVEVCRVVIRSLEGVAAEQGGGSAAREGADVVTAGGPAQSGW